jgi:hypothetical protein
MQSLLEPDTGLMNRACSDVNVSSPGERWLERDPLIPAVQLHMEAIRARFARDTGEDAKVAKTPTRPARRAISDSANDVENAAMSTYHGGCGLL